MTGRPTTIRARQRVGTPFGDELCDWCQTCYVREDEVCTSPAGVRRLDDAKDACSVAAASGEERIEGVTPRYGFTVTASASGGLPFGDSRYAVA